MRSKKNLIIVLIALLTLMAVGCIDSGEIQKVKTTPPPSVETTTQVEETTPVEEAPPEKGSYKNPANIDETVVLSFGGNVYEVSVSDVIRGGQATNVVLSGNMFNSEPPSGYDYLLAKVKVAYTDGDGSASIGSYDFTAFSEGVECESGFVVLPDSYKEFSTGDVMPGGVKDGWVVYTVPQNKEVLISYKPNMFSETACYINIGV